MKAAYLRSNSAYLRSSISGSLILWGVQGEIFPINTYISIIGKNRPCFAPVICQTKDKNKGTGLTFPYQQNHLRGERVKVL